MTAREPSHPYELFQGYDEGEQDVKLEEKVEAPEAAPEIAPTNGDKAPEAEQKVKEFQPPTTPGLWGYPGSCTKQGGTVSSIFRELETIQKRLETMENDGVVPAPRLHITIHDWEPDQLGLRDVGSMSCLRPGQLFVTKAGLNYRMGRSIEVDAHI